MKKRTKRKIYKRIIKKVENNDLLTEFEKQYYIKHFRNPSIANSERIMREIGIDTKINEMRKESSLNPDRITVGTLNAENFNPINVVHVSPKVNTAPLNKKESKWQKVKSKMKGWFGK